MAEVHLFHWSKKGKDPFISILYSLDIVNKIKQAKLILIKPNLAAGTLYGPETGVVTNPLILEEVIHTIRQLNSIAPILIVESDSTDYGFATQKFLFQKYPELVKRYSAVKLYDLTRSPVQVFSIQGGYFKKEIVLPEIFRDPCFFISLAKIKTHTNTVISGVLKNQFGCLPDPEKRKYHPYLSDVISDLNQIIKPDLCILDGCPAMEGMGPIRGNLRNLDLVMVSKDPVAIDTIMASIMGFDPNRISFIKKASKRGIGVMNREEITLKGTCIAEFKTKFSFISNEQKIYIVLGFLIQRIGISIEKLGHMVHLIPSTWWLVNKILKKILQRLFSNETDKIT